MYTWKRFVLLTFLLLISVFALDGRGGTEILNRGLVGGDNCTAFDYFSNGQAIKLCAQTELHTLALAASSSTTITIPAGSVVLGVSTRVTTAITGCSPNAYDVGTAATANLFADALATAIDSTNAGPVSRTFTAATAIRFQCDDGVDSFTGGVIRVTIHYFVITSATS